MNICSNSSNLCTTEELISLNQDITIYYPTVYSEDATGLSLELFPGPFKECNGKSYIQSFPVIPKYVSANINSTKVYIDSSLIEGFEQPETYHFTLFDNHLGRCIKVLNSAPLSLNFELEKQATNLEPAIQSDESKAYFIVFGIFGIAITVLAGIALVKYRFKSKSRKPKRNRSYSSIDSANFKTIPILSNSVANKEEKAETQSIHG